MRPERYRLRILPCSWPPFLLESEKRCRYDRCMKNAWTGPKATSTKSSRQFTVLCPLTRRSAYTQAAISKPPPRRRRDSIICERYGPSTGRHQFFALSRPSPRIAPTGRSTEFWVKECRDRQRPGSVYAIVVAGAKRDVPAAERFGHDGDRSERRGGGRA